MSTSSHDNDSKSSQTPFTNSSEYNKLNFIFSQLLSNVHTFTLVQVVAVTNSGELGEVGFVDVKPLVNMTDYKGNAIPHATVFHLPYFRIQGGGNAIILDPAIGDIGLCAFAEKDISKVKSTKAQANPGSYRKYSMSDGVYLGGVLNGTPTQYVQFNSSGIIVHSPVGITLEAPTIDLETSQLLINATTSTTITTPTFTVNGATVLAGTLTQTGGGSSTMSGSLTTTGAIVAQGTNVHTHTHGGVQTGSGNTGAPN